MPNLEIYGTEGSLRLPDPNIFGGPVELYRVGQKNWQAVPMIRPYQENWRGLGVADMARALRNGRPHRANGDMAFHVLETMHAFHTSSQRNQHVKLRSTCERPAPLPAALAHGEVD